MLPRRYNCSRISNVRYIQVIDEAPNCTFSIFAATEEDFLAIFPESGQDIEFAEDLFERLGDDEARRVVTPMWSRPVRKAQANGIHGTLFYGYAKRRHHYPASKRERDTASGSINAAQRRLNAEEPS